tara:strand:+ start:423 stop:845 length:423 start_codon:yes stop_codon:yes gene_type:complete
MATTTATITLSSSDMMDNNVSISNTATLTNQGNDTGMTKCSGLTRVNTTATSNVILLDENGTGGALAQQAIPKGKVFMQNLNERGDGTKYVTVLLQGAEIGRLYGGDWTFFPWEGGSGNDVEITPSSTTSTDIEYMVFYE